MRAKSRVKQPARKKTAKKKPGLPYERLLKVADQLRPPQSWFDEEINPFEPKRPAR